MSMGILEGTAAPPATTCDCAANSFSPSPSSAEALTTTVFDTAAATLTFTQTDSVSLACGDLSGLTHCGAREVSFTDNATGSSIDVATHPFLSYDSSTGVLSAQSSLMADVGTLVVNV